MKATVGMVATIIVVILIGLGIVNLCEHVNSGEIVVIQSPVAGDLTVYSTPGVKWQGAGKVTRYKIRDQFWFSAKNDQGRKDNESLRIRFNDGAHATISGSISWQMPTDDKQVVALHKQYGSQQAVEQQLVRTIIEKCIYMTGPLMSSAQSYAARRNDLLNLIGDQIEHGVYKTTAKDEKVKDSLTGQEKTIQVVSLVRGPNGDYIREEESPISHFGIKTFNLSINEVTYDPQVELQIQAQQKAIMDVQTAIAKSKTAEQEALTTEQQGKANATKAKWEQEVLKATEVTKAQQEFEVAKTNALKKVEVARLDAEAVRTNAVIKAEQDVEVARFGLQEAELDKKRDIAIGEGDAKRRQLVMDADGALEKRLAAWIEVNKHYADAIKGYQGAWVPSVVMGGSAATGTATAGSGANDLVQLLTVKTARELGLDLGLPAVRQGHPATVTSAEVKK